MRLVRKFFADKPGQKAAGVTIIALLLFFSLWRLSDSPATWLDEGINLGIAKSFVEHGVYSLEIAPGKFIADRQFLITTNYPILLPVALMIKLGGANLPSARLAAVAYLWLFCLAAFILTKRRYGTPAALFTIAFIVSFAPFYGNGKVVLGEIPGLTFFLFGLIVRDGAVTARRLFWCGLLFGIAIAAKPFFLIILPAVFGGELYRIWKKSPCRCRAVWIVLGIIPPLLLWMGTIITPFSLDKLASVASYYSNSYASHDFVRLIAANVGKFVRERTAQHFALLFIITAAWFARRIKRREISETEIIIGVFVVINVLWYLKTPGWFRYFFPAHLLLFLFFPAGVLSLGKRRLMGVLLFFLILAQLAYLVSRRSAQLYNSPMAVRFGNMVMTSTPPSSEILIINNPTIAFLVRNRRVSQFMQINPVLYFGTPTLKDDRGEWYPYLVATSPLDDVAIPAAAAQLTTQYRKVAEAENYVLYQKK